jgi:hypothetical protein
MTSEGYRIFKVISFVLVVLVLVGQSLLVFKGVLDTLDARKLTGGGRAQSELVLLPMVLFGGIGAAFNLLLLLVNAGVDAFQRRSGHAMWRPNALLYAMMALTLLMPVLGPWALLEYLYAGWGW